MATADGYLEKSIVPTFHYQPSLPRLPIPALEETCAKYIEFLQPIVTDQELKEAQQLVDEFAKGEGKQLHEHLVQVDKQNKHTSYINAMWFDMYVEDRRPIPINVNPQLTFVDDTDPAKNDQAARAAGLISSAVRFYRTLRDGHLSPDVFHLNPAKSDADWFKQLIRFVPGSLSWYGAYLMKAFPLDMSQYKHLFHSTRLPRPGKDEVAKFSEAEGRHVAVQVGPHVYAVQVLREDGTAVSDEEIHGQIRAVLADAREAPAAPAVGLLTTMGREDWARVRAEMETNPVNKASLAAIDSALFAVCLEEAAPTSDKELSSVMLHGTARNRWFDKSFQLITCANGKSAVNFEHSWGDGVAVLRFFNEVHKDAQATPLVQPKTPSTPPRRLPWELSPGTVATVDAAGKTMDKWIDSLLVNIAEVPSMTKSVPKQFRISPDGVMQMTIQLAHYKLHGCSVSTYESASTAAFKHGRTETIRSATTKSHAMCKTFADANASMADKERALREAVDLHSANTKNCAMGKGVDRHLFALRHYGQKAGKVPALFEHPSYEKYSKIILSTSTLSSPALAGGGFGPVNEDCYGIGYGIADIGARFVVSSYRKDGGQLAELLASSLEEIEEVLAAGAKK